MDDKLKALVERTNIDQLLAPTSRETDLNQPVQARAEVPDVQVRSTTDPLQVHFATADIIGKLQEPAASSRMRGFALVFIGGPTIVFGLLMIALAITGADSTPQRVFGATVGLAVIAFWPWLIYRGRRRAKKAAPPR